MLLPLSGVRNGEAGPTGPAVAIAALLNSKIISLNLPLSLAKRYY